MKIIFILSIVMLFITACGTYTKEEIINNEPLVIEIDYEVTNKPIDIVNSTLINYTDNSIGVVHNDI